MRTGLVIILAIGIALLAFLYFAPVTPPGTAENVLEEVEEHDHEHDHNPDAEVEEALRQMESGEVPPMQAVLKIREIAEAHPENVKANFTLGMLSMRTGQYEKAVERFSLVLERQPQSAEVWRQLAEAQLAAGNKASAQESFAKAMQFADSETRMKFEKELPELSNN